MALFWRSMRWTVQRNRVRITPLRGYLKAADDFASLPNDRAMHEIASMSDLDCFVIGGGEQAACEMALSIVILYSPSGFC